MDISDPIKIETGIPIPPRPRGNRMARGAKYASTLRAMNDGESIVVRSDKLPLIYAACKRNAWKVVVRTLDETIDGLAAVRVWKQVCCDKCGERIRGHSYLSGGLLLCGLCLDDGSNY